MITPFPTLASTNLFTYQATVFKPLLGFQIKTVSLLPQLVSKRAIPNSSRTILKLESYQNFSRGAKLKIPVFDLMMPYHYQIMISRLLLLLTKHFAPVYPVTEPRDMVFDHITTQVKY